MLGKLDDENELKSMFLPYGNIEEVTILRAIDGSSKGNLDGPTINVALFHDN